MKKRIKLLLVDDHPVVRKGINSCLARHEHLQIVGEAADGVEALKKARELMPDIVLMDISMSRMNGLEATRILRRELPESLVVIVSQNDPSVVLRQAQEVDAAAFVAKSNLSRSLLTTLDRVVGERTG